MTIAKTLRVRLVGEQHMHCTGCEGTIEFSLSQLPGVLRIKANHSDQTIQITHDPDEIDLEGVKIELGWIGYKVEAE